MIRRSLVLVLLALAMLMATSLPALAENGMAYAAETCLECHDDVVSPVEYGASVHGQNACTSCHTGITSLDAHMEGDVMPEEPNCVSCHKQVASEHFSGVHMLNEVGCTDCHSEIHAHTSWKGDKTKAIATCTTCHDDHEDYLESSHGKAVYAGNQDSAACHDCHGLHKVEELGESDSHMNREFHTRVCLTCHADKEMMERNGVFNVAVETYMASYHGKNYRLGFPEKAAGCADCHTSHMALPKDDPRSSVHDDNLVGTCAQCHPNATGLFAKFDSHGDPHDSENYPIQFYTLWGMTGLLLGTFAVFWIHTLLWMIRGFIENREKVAHLHRGEEHHITEPHKQYVRFTRRHIFLHLTVIISFLGLTLTGLPLKFSSQHWAQVMMDFFGGTYYAGLIHRGCAVLTFYYFLSALILSFDFLFVNKKPKGNWLRRLFGPDSLCPNLRDIQDVTSMVRWFLFMGPKPTFERWTYWEKFDFLAVFWGMFAIGGSGLMLWFPEFFGYFLPGWAFNVATIVHSDEALLATGFIFTVHFFNTHGRPEKFPMDFVIFNGQLPKEEFIEERGDQWRRYEEEGITEEFVCKKTSGALYDFCFKTFGYIAVFTGIGCLFLMIFAFMAGGGH